MPNLVLRNLKKFICIRHNAICKAGTWWMAEEYGEPLYRARLLGGPRGVEIIRESTWPVPWESLAPYIVEHGFTISREELAKLKPQVTLESDLIETANFQRQFEDVIEEKVQSNIRRDDPSYKEDSGIIVPATYRGKKDDTEGSK